MKKMLFIFILILSCSFSVILFWQSKTDELYSKTKNDFSFIFSNLNCNSYSSSLISKKLILFHCNGKIADIPFTALKITLEKNQATSNINFYGANLDIIEKTRAHYGTEVLNKVRKYQPYTDLLRKPLLSLGLLEEDVISGNIKISILQSTETPQIHFSFLNKENALSFSLFLQKTEIKDTDTVLDYEVQRLNIFCQKYALLDKYRKIMDILGHTAPPALQQLDGKPALISFMFSVPPVLRDIAQTPSGTVQITMDTAPFPK